MLSVHSLSHPGHTREINEDAAISDPAIGLIAVADGMGGHNAGEVASRLALENIHAFLCQSTDLDEFQWPFGVNPEMSRTANRLMTAMRIANQRVFKASGERADYAGMGTTLVAALFDGARMTFSSVGDSRLYRLKRGKLEQLSHDDSWVVMLAEQAGLDRAAIDRHPMRHVLTSVIGGRTDVRVPIGEIVLEDDEMIALCTDGLHGAVPDHLIASTLQSDSDMSRAAQKLVDTALERDGKDNITVLLARYRTP
jgi:serine/threonine protein phosphatase PrpC